MMTDHAALVARLRERADWLNSMDLLLPEDVDAYRAAADAIEQLTRTVAEREGNDAWWREQRDMWNGVLKNADAKLTAASARLRTVEAETWEQAAEFVRQASGADLIFSESEFRRRAHAAREEP